LAFAVQKLPYRKAGWSYGYASALDCEGRKIWIGDAHRDDGKRLVVRAGELLTAFLELESVIGTAERPEDCGGREIMLDNGRGSSKSLLDYVIRQFHLSSARLNKPHGLNLR
jgi:hypothetical protein